MLSLNRVFAADNAPSSPPLPKVPDGFSIELAAGPPLVERPIVASFDDEGRLYVAESSGSNDPVQKQLELKPHRIVRLEDTDGDGKFDKRTVFADHMMFPEGALFFDGSLYVSAPPSIWKLTDKDGDGVADERVEWYQGKTLTGCANDLHGPYAGPDGWIYWCKGAFAEQTHIVNGKEWKTKAAHIFRCRPDGTGFEPVMTGGMDNPVDVAFMPDGERILSGTFFHVNPRNDGLIHAIYGGVYGKDHGVLDGHPRTGELMPILDPLSAAAGCGLERYDSDVFGADYRDNLFLCQFNLRKVSRHILKPDGQHLQNGRQRFCFVRLRRLPSDRCASRRGRQPARHRHGRLVQALLPDVAVVEAGRGGRHLPRAKNRREASSRSARTNDRLGQANSASNFGRFSATTGPPCGNEQRREFVHRKDSPELQRFHCEWSITDA